MCSIHFDVFKVNKTRAVSTTACARHKNDNKNQMQLLSPYMEKENNKALWKDLYIT